MKTTKSNKKNDLVGSSIKSSFDRLLNDNIFRGLLVLLLIGFIVYIPLVSIQYYLRSEIVYANTVELSSDASIEKVSYVNENGKVFLENGNSIEKVENGYVVLLYGNDFWYSMNEGILATPMTLNQSITNIVSYFLLSWSLFLIMYALVWFICYKKPTKPLSKNKVLSVIVCIIVPLLLVCDASVYISVFKLLSNIPYITVIGWVLSIIIELLKVKLLVKLVESVDKKHGLC